MWVLTVRRTLRTEKVGLMTAGRMKCFIPRGLSKSVGLGGQLCVTLVGSKTQASCVPLSVHPVLFHPSSVQVVEALKPVVLLNDSEKHSEPKDMIQE